MKRWILSYTVMLLAPGMGLAQTAKIQAEIDTELSQARAYEDIEIMRRLLQRKMLGFAQSCQQCHRAAAGEIFWMLDRSGSMPSGQAGSGGGMGPMGAGEPGGAGGMLARDFFHLHGQHVAASESIPVDGHYVKGAGIVMQVQLPASILQFTPPSPIQKKQPPPPSEWEVIRKQLRGEKVEASATAEDPHARIPQSPNIQDVLVQVLAEHGKHFHSLADSERLTLTVTFRPMKEGAAAAGGPGMRGMGEAGGEGGMMVGPGGSGPMGGVTGAGAPQVGPRGSSKDYELLADFHLRQARYAEAVSTFEKAIELNNDSARSSGLYRKLASTLLLQNPNSAQNVERANEFLRKAQAVKPAPAPALKTALPTRLIISASHSALQKASAGSLDDFRRQLAVTWLRFDHPVLRQPVAVPEGPEDGAGNPSK